MNNTEIEQPIGASLPRRYRVCPFTTRYMIPEFEHYAQDLLVSFCPEPTTMAHWYQSFLGTCQRALGSRFLPVCRLADGEFRMLFWPVCPNPRSPVKQKVKQAALTVWEAAHLATQGFRANTAPGVSSGQFSVWEWSVIRRRSSSAFLQIGHEGILALHLGVATVPFQEQYFPAIKRWLKRNRLTLTLGNYVPFYFVYALLRGRTGDFLFRDTRVLVVHSATGERQRRITEAIVARGAASVSWAHISRARSFNDVVDVSSFVGRCDVCFVGAGVGKALVINQLRPLSVPVLDIGFVFEAWVDERIAHTRPFMVPGS